jgi:hypothetical protein
VELITRETVMGETPASFATSRIVGILYPIPNMDLPEEYDIDTI